MHTTWDIVASSKNAITVVVSCVVLQEIIKSHGEQIISLFAFFYCLSYKFCLVYQNTIFFLDNNTRLDKCMYRYVNEMKWKKK